MDMPTKARQRILSPPAPAVGESIGQEPSSDPWLVAAHHHRLVYRGLAAGWPLRSASVRGPGELTVTN
jgi:hypothetical protein